MAPDTKAAVNHFAFIQLTMGQHVLPSHSITFNSAHEQVKTNQKIKLLIFLFVSPFCFPSEQTTSIGKKINQLKSRIPLPTPPTKTKLHLCKEALVQNSSSTTLSSALTKCTAWEFDMNDKMGNTWISEWNLVCDSSYLKTIAETVFLLGVASGGVISGYLSDRFGRKRLLFISVVLQTIFGKFRTRVHCPIWYFDKSTCERMRYKNNNNK